jgi:hypothetical protein
MAKSKARTYSCAYCGRRLKDERWIYSTFTRNRYCWPTEGCWRRKQKSPVRGSSCLVNHPESPQGQEVTKQSSLAHD